VKTVEDKIETLENRICPYFSKCIKENKEGATRKKFHILKTTKNSISEDCTNKNYNKCKSYSEKWCSEYFY